jgi:Tfp pilus assembly ATPase PilU
MTYHLHGRDITAAVWQHPKLTRDYATVEKHLERCEECQTAVAEERRTRPFAVLRYEGREAFANVIRRLQHQDPEEHQLTLDKMDRFANFLAKL